MESVGVGYFLPEMDFCKLALSLFSTSEKIFGYWFILGRKGKIVFINGYVYK